MSDPTPKSEGIAQKARELGRAINAPPTCRGQAMKHTQLEKAALARLKQAQAHTATIDVLLLELRQGADIGKKMPKLRILCASLTQAVHEFNAYRNAIEIN